MVLLVRGFAVVLLVLVSVPAGADPMGTCVATEAQANPFGLPRCIPPDSPPANVAGSYDEATNVLTITWDAPPGPPPDEYAVYRYDLTEDGSDSGRVGVVTSTSITDDLSSFSGYRSYTVYAHWGTEASDSSLPLTVARFATAGGDTCVGVVVGEMPPVFVDPEDCV